jgi:hypothetical protein
MLKKIASVAFLTAAIPASSASAATPAWDLGSFEMGAPAECGGLLWCGSVAQNVLDRDNLQPKVWSRDLVSGYSGETVIVVLCVPTSATTMEAAVFTSSEDGLKAEYWRNRVRTEMRGVACL